MWPIVNPEDPRGESLISPMDYQTDFAFSEAFATLLAGGWGSGKSFGGLMFCALSSWLNGPGNIGVAGQPSYPMMEEWLQTQLLPAFSKIIIDHQVKKRCLILPGDRKIYYRSAHIPRNLQMTNASWLYLDEPHLMKEEIWKHVVSRARKKNAHLRIGMTSLPKGWIRNYFEGQNNLEYRCMHVKTEWNKHNNPDYIRNLKRACPTRMHPCYLEGEFVAAGGLVFVEFDPLIHIIPWTYSPYTKLSNGQTVRSVVNLAIDWSSRRPHVLWVQRVPHGTVMPDGTITQRETSIVIDEIYPDGQYQKLTVQRLCRMIRSKTPPGCNSPCHLDAAVVDPAGKVVQATSGESEIIQAQRELNIPILYKQNQRIVVGVEHVQTALDPMEGLPYLYFSDRLTHGQDNPRLYDLQHPQRSVIKAMQTYGYPEDRDGKLAHEPFDDDITTHACDCMRYHVRYYYPIDRLLATQWRAA